MGNDFEPFFEISSVLGHGGRLKKLSRHLALSGWGPEEQAKLDSMSILVVGAGGLGSTLCLELCGSVFGNNIISIIDPDVVEESNLHRQIAFSESDIGKPKATRLAELCYRRNNSCHIKSIVGSLDDSNVIDLFAVHDVIFDCTDNLPARILISDTWKTSEKSKLVISASCVGWCGQIVRLDSDTPFCLRCIYGDAGSVSGCDRLGQCALQGVMGPVVSAVASLQLMALIHVVKDPRAKRTSFLQLVDFSSGLMTHEVHVAPNCASCCSDTRVFQSIVSALCLPDSSLEIESVQLLSLLMEGSCIIIDVRERSHFKCSKLRRSVNFPASHYVHAGVDLKEDSALCEVIRGRGESIVTVCRRGFDSLKFVHRIKEVWPELKMYSLSGGLTGLSLDIV